jgi:hypothetical protein
MVSKIHKSMVESLYGVRGLKSERFHRSIGEYFLKKVFERCKRRVPDLYLIDDSTNTVHIVEIVHKNHISKEVLFDYAILAWYLADVIDTRVILHEMNSRGNYIGSYELDIQDIVYDEKGSRPGLCIEEILEKERLPFEFEEIINGTYAQDEPS